MWKVLLALGLVASASATWKPIVGPSSSSFNKKIPFGDSHTYYGNEFLSEYANLGAEHLLLPSQHATVLEAEPLRSSFGSDVITGISEPDWWISTEISLPLSPSAGQVQTPEIRPGVRGHPADRPVPAQPGPVHSVQLDALHEPLGRSHHLNVFS